jgi:hypothetical protein
LNFLHSSFLWAGIFLAIPIIVHLFNLRKYRKEYFSNTTMLKTILNQTQKTSQLKKRLILAARLLAFFFIILAFLQPFFKSSSASNSGTAIVSIYIDNSFSMQSPTSNLLAIAEAKKKAKEIIQANSQAQYQVLTNDFKSNELQLVSMQEALEIVASIEISHQKKTADEIWDKQIKTTASNSSENKIYYWLSDFQRNQIKPIAKQEFSLYCIPIVHDKLKNIYIDTAYIHSPIIKLNQEVKIIYRVHKSKDDDVKSSLISLAQNEQVKARKEIIWADKKSFTDTFIFKAINSDWQFLKLSIADQSMDFDNDYFFTFYISPKPFVTMINGGVEQQFITNALKADENFDIHQLSNSNLSPDEIKNSNLVILNHLNSLPTSDQIQIWLQANKNIVIFPSRSISLQNNNSIFTQLGVQSFSNLENFKSRIKQFNLQDILFQNLFTQIEKINDYPSFNSYYSLEGFSNRAKEVLISLDNGKPLLVKYSRLGEGTIYLFTASIEATNSDFVFSYIFAPMIYKLGALTSSYQVNSYFIAPHSLISLPVESNSQDKIYKIVGDKTSIIPPQRKIGNTLSFSIPESISKSGFYSLEDASAKKIFQLALNHTRDESKLDFLTTGELKEILGYENLNIDKGSSAYLKNMQSFSGSNLWKLWTIFAAIFLGIEMLLVLYWDKLILKFNIK